MKIQKTIVLSLAILFAFATCTSITYSGNYYVQYVGTGLCVDTAGTGGNGGGITQQTCSDAQTQQWTFTLDAAAGTYMIQSPVSNCKWNVDGGSNSGLGSLIFQWDCNNAAPSYNELYKIVPATGKAVNFVDFDNWCMTAQNNGVGDAFVQQTCNGGNTQEFLISPTPFKAGNAAKTPKAKKAKAPVHYSGNYYVKFSGSDLCLDTTGTGGNGGTITQQKCSKAKSQQWTFNYVANGGTYYLVNPDSGCKWNIDGGGGNAGALLFQWDCFPGQPSQNELFDVVPRNGRAHHVQFKLPYDGLCIEAQDSGTGDTFYQQTCSNAKNQHFHIRKTPFDETAVKLKLPGKAKSAVAVLLADN